MTVSFHQIISIDIESDPDQHWFTLTVTDRSGKKDEIDVFCDSLSEEYGKDGAERKQTIFSDLQGQLRRIIEES